MAALEYGNAAEDASAYSLASDLGDKSGQYEKSPDTRVPGAKESCHAGLSGLVECGLQMNQLIPPCYIWATAYNRG
jgi:hypothetical protein